MGALAPAGDCAIVPESPVRFLVGIVVTPVILGCLLWGVAAIWIDGPADPAWAGGAIVAWVTAVLAALLIARPLRRGLLAFAVLFAMLLAWWFSLAPSNDRPWEPSVAREPRFVLDGDRLTVYNLRNFEYRSETDFDEIWEERSYDLSGLTGVDLFLSYWSSPLIAHTIVSWTFEDGPPLSISIETRKEIGEEYSAILGFFRQFELYYVVADERDVVRLRTNNRGEDVYLYPMKLDVDVARRLLLDYVAQINDLASEPAWYNAATHNCTTTIRHHMYTIGDAGPWDYRFLVNGRIDQLAYERGSVDTSLPFGELRRRSNIVDAAILANDSEDFSERIREGLPGR